jgi:hypothetical protein
MALAHVEDDGRRIVRAFTSACGPVSGDRAYTLVGAETACAPLRHWLAALQPISPEHFMLYVLPPTARVQPSWG